MKGVVSRPCRPEAASLASVTVRAAPAACPSGARVGALAPKGVAVSTTAKHEYDTRSVSIAQIASLRGEVQSVQELLRLAYEGLAAAQALCRSAHVLDPDYVALKDADPETVQRMKRKLAEMKASIDHIDKHDISDALVATEVLYEHAWSELKRLGAL